MSDIVGSTASPNGLATTPLSSSKGTPNSRGAKRKDSDRDVESVKGSESSPGGPSPARSNTELQKDASKDMKDKDRSAGKRIKTARACDSCRRKKIRCDVIDDGGPPMGSLNNGNGGLICAHCRQYGFECTFFLPITETRFKKKHQREAEEAAAAVQAAQAAASAAGATAGMSRMGMQTFPLAYGAANPAMMMVGPPFPGAMPANISPLRNSASQEWPSMRQQQHLQRPSPHILHQPRPSYAMQAKFNDSKHPMATSSSEPNLSALASKRSSPGTPPPDTRVLGPTSIAYIVHSTAFVPGAAIEAHDIKHNQTFEVGASGDGIIRFHKPRKLKNSKGTEAGTTSADEDEITRIPESIKGRLAGDVAEKLVNTYFEKVATLFPVVTKSEFVHLSPPPPLLLYAICGVAALSRDVPREVLGAVKMTINALFRENDFLSNSNSVTVRALLIMSLHADLHGPTALQSGTRCWNRTGAAIRMAQDLGLHRDASGKDDLHQDTFFLEQKRRIWGCCVTADRIQSTSLGHPLMIDLTDCDVRLPSPFEILRSSNDLPSDPTTDRPFAFNTEMLKLTILFGRVMKTIYSPTGLMNATDEEINSLLQDIDNWKANLPAELVFKGADASPPSGILHVGFACLMMLFFRVFMRISYICPTHLKFSLTIERMSSLIQYSTDAIAWVDKNDFYLDTMQIVSYCLVSCATVQYHAWIRRGDQNAQNQLKKLNEVMTRYRKENDDPNDSGMRGKAASVISLLCDSAGGVYANTPSTSGSLNPTAGVTNRKSSENVRGIVFKPDATRPGGGVYVATDKNLFLRDLPQGTIIMQETQDGNRIPALVRTGTDQNGGWQTYEQFRAALLGAQKDGSTAGLGGIEGSLASSLANGNFAMLNSFTTSLSGATPSTSTNGTEGGNNSSINPFGSTTASTSNASPSTGLTTANASGDGNSISLNPPGANLVHLGGDVWQDSEGRPVTRSGSRLLTMVPIAPGGSAGNMTNAFSEANFMWSPSSSTLPSSVIGGVGGSGMGGLGTQLSVTRNAIMPDNPNFNFNPHLNNAYWAPAEFFDINNHMGSSGNTSGMGANMEMSGSGTGDHRNGAGSEGGSVGVSGTLASGIDPNIIDGIPGAPLDFANWDLYFSKVGNAHSNNNNVNNNHSENHNNGNDGSSNTNQQTTTGNGQAQSSGDEAGGGFATSTFGIEAQMMDAGGF